MKEEVKVGYYAKYMSGWYKIKDINEDRETLIELLGWVCASKFTDVRKMPKKEFVCGICGDSLKIEVEDSCEYSVDPVHGALSVVRVSVSHANVVCTVDKNHNVDDKADLIYKITNSFC